jgi:tetrapyrrole methylase family protein / MazG family protein
MEIANERAAAAAFNRLYELIITLRAPGGCPWDRDQTPLSMRRDLVEEVFEAIDAITSDDPCHVKEELGDVVLNTCLIAYMYEQRGDFSVADTINELCDKLIRRHPHVFPESAGRTEMTSPVRDAAEVLTQWDRIKQHVEGRQGKSILDEVPAGFPPLLKAGKLQKKAAKKGFDWQSLPPVLGKIYEELTEVQEAAHLVDQVVSAAPGKDVKPFAAVEQSADLDAAQIHLEEEIGDLLFSVVNYARHLGVDPSVALERTNAKFYRRFTYVEQHMEQAGIAMDSDHLAQMDAFWNDAKKLDS